MPPPDRLFFADNLCNIGTHKTGDINTRKLSDHESNTLTIMLIDRRDLIHDKDDRCGKAQRIVHYV